MFDPAPTAPRVFALPPGADFPARLIDGLNARLASAPPQALADVRLIVNTSRMARRLEALLAGQGALLMPRIGVIDAIATTDAASFGLFGLPPVLPPLRRRLELLQLVQKLLEGAPDLAPRAAGYGLADSLADLLDEMQGDGITADALHQIDVSQHSAHWERSLKFLSIVLPFTTPRGDGLDPNLRSRIAVEMLLAQWQANPPTTPILIAGSTGSRSTTARLMAAVAQLPQGAVILPGFDSDQPDDIWDQLARIETAEDHPQDRFRQFLQRIDLPPSAVQPWTQNAVSPQVAARNALISLALRPAPVTDQWRSEGPRLRDLADACQDMALVEADSPRTEAAAIAVAIREAIAAGKRVAVITPDRQLTRQVTAALDRWRILPDDSAGRPLAYSAPGRLLRLVAQLADADVDAETLMILLKHPLTSSSSDSRGAHLRNARLFELWLRESGPAHPTAQHMDAWAAKHGGTDGPERRDWAAWVGRMIDALRAPDTDNLADRIDHHVRTTQAIAAGYKAPLGAAGGLWDEAAGREAAGLIETLRDAAAAAGSFAARDYAIVFDQLAQGIPVRDAARSRPDVMIWGTLEARVQGADVVILGGLNDGIWPSQPPPDPWLNRQMRKAVGLSPPERRIGLQAHDFQQAIAAETVILTRAGRDAEAETVASRWLNRVTNLLGGLAPEGTTCLEQMRARGARYLHLARQLERPDARIDLAKRPAPCPPLHVRPTEISVTEVERLRRDPYAIYAKRLLRLAPLDPLRKPPDALMRGSVFHEILEDFVRQTWTGLGPDAEDLFLRIAEDRLQAEGPWNAALRGWRTHLHLIAPGLIEAERARRAIATPIKLEVWGERPLPNGGRLYGKADRIDQMPNGDLVLYDYKSGSVPGKEEMKAFNRQLQLEAAIAEVGGFEGLARNRVAEVRFLSLNAGLGERGVSLAEDPDFVAETWKALLRLRALYEDPDKGYLSRRAARDGSWGGDYDHLARYGEWNDTDEGQTMPVGRLA